MSSHQGQAKPPVQPPPKVQVYFCRHAESRHNAYRDDTTDVDLTELGETQARALRGTFDLVLCSPMRRTRRTLELSGIRYSRLEVVPELREWVEDNADRLHSDPPDFRETRRDLVVRCQAVWERLRALVLASGSDGEDPLTSVLLVSHKVFGDQFYSICGTRCPSRHIENAVIYPLEFRP